MFEAMSVPADEVDAGHGFMGLLRRQDAVALLERPQPPVHDEDDLRWALAGLDYLARETGPLLMADLEALRQRVHARLRTRPTD